MHQKAETVVENVYFASVIKKKSPGPGISGVLRLAERPHVKIKGIMSQISRSPNYRNGSFHNLSPTPMKAEGVSYFKMIRDAWRRPKSVRPLEHLPSVKTDLSRLHAGYPSVIWFGHSSYMIHHKGKYILVDPVFSGHASPLPFMIKSFPGTDIYKPEDFPHIDLLIITHNHYDHLDRKFISRISSRIGSCYAPLGVGNLLKKQGIRAVTELDWWESATTEEGLTLTATPARHFSGRGLKRNGSLWASFILELPGYKLFIGGDSGYDTHFSEIGKHGPFDLAILECGQYNASWPLIHMMPEETVQAAIDVQAKALLPVHWGKFTLANHPWKEPVIRARQKAKELQLTITTPMIGEPVILSEYYPAGTWWMQIK